MENVEWREVIRWKRDDKPETTDAVVVVSNTGRVKRLEFKYWHIPNNSYSISKEYEYVLGSNRGKQRSDSDEKIQKCGLYKHANINGKIHLVHRLVAKAFIPNTHGKPHINHIDGVRSNNYVENLEWVTRSENIQHAISSGLMTFKDKFGMLTSDEKDLIIKLRKLYYSTTEIANLVSCSHETVNEYIKSATIDPAIHKEIKSIAKILEKVTTGITKVESIRGTTEYILSIKNKYVGKFNSAEDAILEKGKYITDRFEKDSMPFIKWDKLFKAYMKDKNIAKEEMNLKALVKRRDRDQILSLYIDKNKDDFLSIKEMIKLGYPIEEIKKKFKMSKNTAALIIETETDYEPRTIHALYTTIKVKEKGIHKKVNKHYDSFIFKFGRNYNGKKRKTFEEAMNDKIVFIKDKCERYEFLMNKIGDIYE